ncbi:MAG: LytTR family transcriptional regulator DNA-binding domain-containing protein [Bacteroidetes bacterium]|nr:LytTR family transcriptional regulator DNA-binding domain-containing protein [Bacteroidota bacterium]
MKALIIDDERLARQELKSLLSEYPEIEIIGEANNADMAIGLIKELNPELIFLDIQMPGKTGFDLLKELDKVPKVIFVTAYDDYAMKAFDVNALDYLLKPVQPKRLEEALNKVLKAAEPGPGQEVEKAFSQEVLGENDQVFVKDGEKCWFVKLADVRLFESEGNYVRVYFNNNRPLILKSLNSLEERLNSKVFFRASRKHIINLKWIESIESWFNGGLMVKLREGGQIEVSRRQAAKFREMMSL